MVVIKVEPLSHDDGLPVGFAYLVNMDCQAQTMQLADTLTEAMLFENKAAAAQYWNSHMSQLINPPMVSVELETPTLH